MDHVLIVEDETRLRMLIANVLQEVGYCVSQAADGERAIALLEQATRDGISYDVVISDIVMGSMSGIDVLNVATRQPYLPEVILLTGKATIETAIEAVRAGAFDYLLKPCLISRILERVAAACEYRKNRLIQERAVEILQTIANVATTTLEVAHVPHTKHVEIKLPEVPPSPLDSSIQIGFLRIDTRRYEVWFHDQQINVTPTEFALLACLAKTPEEVVTFSNIVLHTHGKKMDREEARRIIAPHILHVRQKIDRRYVVSIARIGYMLVNPDVP